MFDPLYIISQIFLFSCFVLIIIPLSSLGLEGKIDTHRERNTKENKDI